ncbi:MAG: hypothetical protein JO286_16750 [Solirubrobacterales bacterium]|nr:hypothetical protein [Solirubrobacterales bacterium]MBV9366657.1 hypothetical protein [Solirubrobacterales bacterium]MBV9682478.1 hypothetical protein [Solirubrobacterales bacterium]MBV9808836.1 hypothetical protein [Solirubrobacterales bacterium]
MNPRSLVRRHLSVPLVVSFLALFVALGGAGWAALRIPPNSVGNAQLQNFSVGNAKLRPNSVGSAKIIAGAVGARQVNSRQVQLRVTSSCLIGAIQALSLSGNVTCAPAPPNEYGTLPQNAALGPSQQQVAGVSLPATQAGSSYLVIGDVQVDEAEGSAPQSVSVSCSMSLGGGSGTNGDFDTNLGATNATNASGTIPLVLPVSIAGAPQTVAINCEDVASPASPAPSVNVMATIHAIQTAANADK